MLAKQKRKFLHGNCHYYRTYLIKRGIRHVRNRLISARKSSLSNDIRHGSSTARIALKLANDPDKFLSTIQIGITLIGILTGIYSGDVLATDFGNILTDAGVPAHMPIYWLKP